MTDPGKSEREPVAAETRASLRAEEVARLAAVHARRRRYWENGYRPIEIWSHDRRFADNGKRLNSPGKQPRGCWREAAKRNPPDAVTRAPYAGATNTGISCEDEIIGADVDVPVQDLADQVVVVAEARFGITPLVRIGLAPKILLVYRAPPAAFGKIQTTELFLPDGTKLKVELLANGQQFVVDGIHPDTGKPYIWTGASPEDVRREELPEITEEAARTFVAEVEELLRAAGAKPREKPGKGTNNPPRPSIPPGAKGGDPGSHGDGFFRVVNAAALADIAAWAPGLLPRGHWEDRTGAWRISSKDLGRILQEDLSIHPGGIRDFGTEETLTPIDLVIRYDSERSKPLAAALWLCEQLGVDPTNLGGRGGNGIDEAGRAELGARMGPATSENIEPSSTDAKTAPPRRNGRDREAEPRSDNPKVGKDFDTDTSWVTPAPGGGPWPEIDSEAFYGLAGQVVDTLAPETEADPAALLMMFLAEAGNQIGRGPFFQVGSKRHYLNLYALLIGETAKARKGTAAAEVQPVLELADEEWQLQTGLSSGEGIIQAVHDEVRVREKVSGGKGQKPQYVEVVKEENVEDKRLMIIEEEFGGALEVMQREGSILSRVLRDAWDGRKLATMTKHSPTRATGAHVSIVGHITVDELRDKLDRTSMFNGYANRFLFACVRRAQLLPFGGDLDPAALDRFADRLRDIREAADGSALARRITFHATTRPIWQAEYALLSAARPGLLGAVTARAEAQTARLATLYAVLDFSAYIEPKHLAAALAVWRYCEASAKYIFGEATGNPVADAILAALRQHGSDGMTRTQISELFGRNRGADKIGAALAFLLSHGKARYVTRPRSGGGLGRGVEVWLAC